MAVQLVRTVQEFRAACDALRGEGLRVGLVPTMGALHAGHRALMEHARELGTAVTVTLFVNPTQFGPNEDFSKYPRQLEADLALCEAAGVRLVFAPDASEMYPAGETTRVRVDGLTAGLCGASRPGHFEGVTTIVTKLFAVTGPCIAVFGRKDYQQFKVLERMARDLLLPVTVVGHPTVREADGLALSSRNVFLAPDERTRALALARGLSRASQLHAAGERHTARLRACVEAALSESAITSDYISLTDPDSLEACPADGLVGERVLLALAARVGSTRLIDNSVLGQEPAPLTLGAA